MLIDWLEGTILKADIEKVVEMVKRYFCFLPWSDLENGWRGYTRTAKVGRFGFVAWCPERPDMGVHLTFSSEALGEICGETSTVESLCFDLDGMAFRGSRIDIAGDDFEGRLDLDRIQKAVEERTCCHHFRKVAEMHDLQGGDGRTINFGKRGSETFFRIYDKSAEQAAHHKGVHPWWVRAEMELHGKRAAAAFKQVAHNKDWREAAAGWFLAALDFKERGSTIEKWRWEHAAWWTEFLATVQKVRLFVRQVVRTVSSIEAWIRKQVVPSLYVLEHFMGVGGLLAMVQEGANRLTAEQQEMAYSISPVWGLR